MGIRVNLLHLKAGDKQASGGAWSGSRWWQQQVRDIFLAVGFLGEVQIHREGHATGLQSGLRDELYVPWTPGHREVTIKPGLGFFQLEAVLLP